MPITKQPPKRPIEAVAEKVREIVQGEQETSTGGPLVAVVGQVQTATPSPKNAEAPTSQKSTGQTPSVEGNQAPQVVQDVVSKAEGWGEPRPGTYLLRIDSVTKAKINYVLDRMPGRLSMQKYIMGLIDEDLKQQLKKLQ